MIMKISGFIIAFTLYSGKCLFPHFLSFGFPANGNPITIHYNESVSNILTHYFFWVKMSSFWFPLVCFGVYIILNESRGCLVISVDLPVQQSSFIKGNNKLTSLVCVCPWVCLSPCIHSWAQPSQICSTSPHSSSEGDQEGEYNSLCSAVSDLSTWRHALRSLCNSLLGSPLFSFMGGY